jgi:hypothetical protein
MPETSTACFHAFIFDKGHGRFLFRGEASMMPLLSTNASLSERRAGLTEFLGLKKCITFQSGSRSACGAAVIANKRIG